MRNYNFKLYNFIMNIFVISNKRIFNKIHIQSELFDFDFLYRKKKKEKYQYSYHFLKLHSRKLFNCLKLRIFLRKWDRLIQALLIQATHLLHAQISR